MQRVVGLLVASAMSVLGGGLGFAETSATPRTSAPPVYVNTETGQPASNSNASNSNAKISEHADNTSPMDVEALTRGQETHCYLQFLERYTHRSDLTVRLFEDRTRARFERDGLNDQQPLPFRSELTPEERKEFEQQVERYTRLHEFTLRLQEQQELKEALAYAQELALQEKKREFTKKLLESRQSDPSQSPVPTPGTAVPAVTVPGAGTSKPVSVAPLTPASAELPSKAGLPAPSAGLVTR